MNANVMAWNEDERRVGSMAAFGTALVVVLGALAVWWFVAATPDWVYWALVGLLALVLVFMAVLLFVPARAAAPAADAHEGHAAHAAPEAHEHGAEAPAPAQAFEPRVLTLRCGDCGTIFEVTDTGERPLYHTCPGCGAEGALRDPVEAPAEEAAAPEAHDHDHAPEHRMPEAATQAAIAPPIAAPAPAAVKKMKLRCGGCKEVFSIEDSGERPLRRACPHCGRVGQVN